MSNLTEIIEKIEKLRWLDSRRQIFGSSSHNNQLNSRLDEGIVGSLEAKYGIDLPDDYRRFLLEVGNGGAGPYYGLFKLGEHDSGEGFCSWEDGYLLGDPSSPFPYQNAWNLSDSFWADAPHHKEWKSNDASDKAYEAWDAKLNEVYWTPSAMNGAIPICHCGCALRQWLVVTGSERGNIWQDDRVDWKGVFPLVTENGKRVTFTGWYVGWLDESIRSIEQR